ncbi:thiamine phosphate synthase [Schumannella luteola]|uniref:Thiamine-phosphate synthase n=1 Tax=Schumannella luteola TaxID=472059 RepID=A0A852YD43_9MICO|nr:thiamine-phosphate diphosphorylase [Schumannella luteola]TPX01600.1 thiamine phosphate synthase [Schumannella luteola]
MSGWDLRLQLVTDERVERQRLLRAVGAAVDAGAGVVQLRAKGASAREQLGLLGELDAVIGGRAALIVNDRLDVALAGRDAGLRVAGVHLGQSDVPPTTARRLLGTEALVGWTADTADHFAAAAALPAGTLDYLGVGVIHPTATKPGHPPALGVEGFRALAAVAPLPCVAIGGVTEVDAGSLTAAGAAGVAVVSRICAADDPASAARAIADAVGIER